jgi:hypothetical protein
MILMRLVTAPSGFIKTAVDPVADPQTAVARLDMNIARAFFDRVVNDVIHQPNHGRLTGEIGRVADVIDGRFDQRDVGLGVVLDDVVDDERLAVRQRRDHPPDIFSRRGDNLNLQARLDLQLIDQKQIRRLSDRDRQRAANLE